MKILLFWKAKYYLLRLLIVIARKIAENEVNKVT